MEKTIIERNEVTPEKIFETCSAHMRTEVLVSGVDLEVYTHIKNGHRTAVEIAKAAQASPRGMEILLNRFPMSSMPVSPTMFLSRENQGEGG